jgi:hypothetical protein
VIARPAARPARIFVGEDAWRAHPAALGIGRLAAAPDPVRIATEGALRGAARRHGPLEGTAIVSDDAGRFRLGEHALRWAHAERPAHKPVPTTPERRRAVDLARALIWWPYADLKAWRRDPCPRRAAAPRARLDRIFQRRAGHVALGRLPARSHRRRHELLRVLERPEIPLRADGSESDLRARATERRISGGAMSEAGRTARDALLGLMKTCARHGVSPFRHPGGRLGIPGAPKIPPRPDLVRQAATA